MQFFERLKELRSEKGLTQQRTAELLGLTRTRYSLYELGVREPSIELLKVMANFFNTTIDYLVGYSDNY